MLHMFLLWRWIKAPLTHLSSLISYWSIQMLNMIRVKWISYWETYADQGSWWWKVGHCSRNMMAKTWWFMNLYEKTESKDRNVISFHLMTWASGCKHPVLLTRPGALCILQKQRKNVYCVFFYTAGQKHKGFLICSLATEMKVPSAACNSAEFFTD